MHVYESTKFTMYLNSIIYQENELNSDSLLKLPSRERESSESLFLFFIQEQLRSVEEDKARFELQLQQLTEATTAAESERVSQLTTKVSSNQRSLQNHSIPNRICLFIVYLLFC